MVQMLPTTRTQRKHQYSVLATPHVLPGPASQGGAMRPSSLLTLPPLPVHVELTA